MTRKLYERVREKGPMLPDGLSHVDSWVSRDLTTCFQLMECRDAGLLGKWTAHWEDLADFTIIPVVSSSRAAEMAVGSASGNDRDR